MKSDNKNNFSSPEFALGVTCLYFNIPLVAIERVNESTQKVNFVFKRTPELEQVVRDFWNDELSVAPKRWHALSRDLKARIKNELTLGI